jgi:glucose/arabinose dehydrogenase
VSDPGNHVIHRFAPDGTEYPSFGTGLENPQGLAFDSAGYLFASEFLFNTIYKFASDGAQSTFATGLNGPYGLAFDSAGYLYEADSVSGVIYKFAPDGTQSTFATGLNAPTGLAFDSAG